MPPEVWLRGPIPGIPPLLQPVAHSLLQSREEVAARLPVLTPEELWRRPGEAASAGYHVLHAAGAIDRLLGYARDETLTAAQQSALEAEAAAAAGTGTLAADALLELFDARVEAALAQVRATPETALSDARQVGRAKLPSTVIGLLFHAAEHTQRHVGSS